MRTGHHTSRHWLDQDAERRLHEATRQRRRDEGRRTVHATPEGAVYAPRSVGTPEGCCSIESVWGLFGLVMA
jgi:hypothetical protein